VVDRIDAALVIVDLLGTYLRPDRSATRDQDVRQTLAARSARGRTRSCAGGAPGRRRSRNRPEHPLCGTQGRGHLNRERTHSPGSLALAAHSSCRGGR
jgi:hypothetical protein